MKRGILLPSWHGSLAIGTILLLASINNPAAANELLANPAKIISPSSGKIPQAPRVSPDGRKIVFENYTKERVELWHASSDGKGAHCLTCDGENASYSLENAFWHPSGKYIIFNEVPEGNVKTGGIFVGQLQEGKLVQVSKVAEGARPQFSRPNGHVIFYETSKKDEAENTGAYDRVDNLLAYQIIGRDPMKPLENMRLELRGPIQQVNESAEISHPSLAPDGSTIVFAARSTVIRAPGQIVLSDIDRQKIYKLWQKLISLDREKIRKEVARLGKYNKQIPRDYDDSEDYEADPAHKKEKAVMTDYPLSDAFRYIMADEAFLAQPTIVPGYTRKYFYLAYVLGLIDKLDSKHDQNVQEMIFPRLWVTDVFGAPVVPLVKDATSTPLPQKWPTVSHDGKFVVFEAGHYTDRHIYLVARKKSGWIDKTAKYVGVARDEWMDTAIKITERGTYNSSPELDPTGEWLYFESNRDGTKAIWRAKLNWAEINKKLGFDLR